MIRKLIFKSIDKMFHSYVQKLVREICTPQHDYKIAEKRFEYDLYYESDYHFFVMCHICKSEKQFLLIESQCNKKNIKSKIEELNNG